MTYRTTSRLSAWPPALSFRRRTTFKKRVRAEDTPTRLRANGPSRPPLPRDAPPKKSPPGYRRSESGTALLIALAALALVAALSAAALSLATGPATRAAAATEQARAKAVAEGALHRLAAAVSAQDLRATAPLDGSVISTDFMGSQIRFSAQDVTGLIDLNAASTTTLHRLLTLTGATRPDEIIALWTIEREKAQRIAFDAPEAALALLPAPLAQEAVPALAHATTWSGRAQIDPRTATAPALAAATGISLGAARRYVAERTASPGARPPLPGTANRDALTFSDMRTARVEIRTETPAGGRAVVRATLRLSTSPRAPVTILSWR